MTAFGCLQALPPLCVCVCARACARACIRLRVHACVCVSAPACAVHAARRGATAQRPHACCRFARALRAGMRTWVSSVRYPVGTCTCPEAISTCACPGPSPIWRLDKSGARSARIADMSRTCSTPHVCKVSVQSTHTCTHNQSTHTKADIQRHTYKGTHTKHTCKARMLGVHTRHTYKAYKQGTRTRHANKATAGMARTAGARCTASPSARSRSSPVNSCSRASAERISSRRGRMAS